MQIILIIVALGALVLLWEYFKEHPVGVVLTIAIIVLVFIAWPVALMLTLGWVLFMIVGKNKTKNNRPLLIKYLNENCKYLGCLSNVDLSTIAPDFVSKNYENTTYEGIVMNFLRSNEEQLITKDKQLRWLKPALQYLEENMMADVYELEKICASKGLQASHITPDGKLICDAMKGLCATKFVNGQHKYSQVKIEATGARNELNLPKDANVPDYYLWAFRVEDTTSKQKSGSPMGNIISEEISADDLGIDI